MNLLTVPVAYTYHVHMECGLHRQPRGNIVFKPASLFQSALKISALLTLTSAALFAQADEPKLLLEEVTVIGAVRGSAHVDVADIDVAGDDSLTEMPVAYE